MQHRAEKVQSAAKYTKTDPNFLAILDAVTRNLHLRETTNPRKEEKLPIHFSKIAIPFFRIQKCPFCWLTCSCFSTNGKKYLRMDQIKFVGNGL